MNNYRQQCFCDWCNEFMTINASNVEDIDEHIVVTTIEEDPFLVGASRKPVMKQRIRYIHLSCAAQELDNQHPLDSSDVENALRRM